MNIARTLLKEYWRARFFLDGPRLAPASVPKLSYAGSCPEGSLPARGGNVKLISLDRAFPEQKRAANLLYLVSSGINVRAEAWADVCLSRGIKLVWNQNGVAYPAWAPRGYQRINSRMRDQMHRASFVIYQSEFCRRMSDKYLGVFKGPSAVIYNAVDTETFVPQPQGQGRSRTLRVLVVGSHADPRRFLRAIDTVALLRRQGVPAELDIAGRLSWPDAERELRAAAARSGLTTEVRLLGPFSQGEAPGLYRRADVLLHLQHGDACPTVVLEAMACGVPVVAPASGGIPELAAEAGVLLDAPDAESSFLFDAQRTAEAVTRAWHQHDRLASLARERVVARFSVRNWIEQHQQIFRKVLGP